MASLSNIWRDKRLSLSIKIRTYKALILSTLLYAAETWTVRAEDARILDSFHVKCQRQILGIRWQDPVRNAEVTIQTGLPPVIDYIVERRNAIFGHIARMPSNVPVHQALSCQVDLSLGRPSDRSWKRRPGRPPKRWLNQIRDDSRRPQPMCGETLSDAVIVERRNGLRRLRANNDDRRVSWNPCFWGIHRHALHDVFFRGSTY